MKYNNAQFADLVGISRQAVGKAVKSGQIYKSPDGIDPTHERNAEYIRQSQERQRQRAPMRSAVAVAAAVDVETDHLDGLGLQELNERKLKAEIALKEEQKKTAEQKRLAVARELVDRKEMLRIVHEKGAMINTHILGLSRQIAPEIHALAQTVTAHELQIYLSEQIAAAIKRAKLEDVN